MAKTIDKTAGKIVDGEEIKRRDFLFLTAGSLAGIGAAMAVWPFVDSMNPARDVLFQAETEVDLSPIEKGQAIIVKWQGKPVFVRRRTRNEIDEAQDIDIEKLRDPQTDKARVKKPEWLIVIGICTHLGCIPLGNKTGDPRGQWGGWFCTCHGSQYDTSGRIRKGPAPYNLAVPPYRFIDDSKIIIGKEKA